MASSTLPGQGLYTEIVQVLRGGEPDEDGISLVGLRSPVSSNINPGRCACTFAPFLHSLWDFLDRWNPYEEKNGIWLRILPADCVNTALPPGATLLDTRRVSYEVA
ncbi:hypothetical protein [Nocardiopsis lambiniae]|uniref:Uncharacterized protein n=1 Tax=Nocardiopsis lambiniae TaxID=3075539 RepID=A0ABU2MK04_9ACTN|nr:hypothetical protein [Nocardiopsis sp. DSM 44743]MDT0332136.1 hypothetical protein [Nocardiopsis sp. DSM 44743]